MKTILRAIWRALRTIVLALLTVVMFIEEWGWKPLTGCIAWLAKWPPLARLEQWLRAVSPPVALAMFCVPTVALIPVKLVAVSTIHQGHAMLGLMVILAAKLLGTALLGRLFILVEPQLMQFEWMARGILWWRDTRSRVLAWVRASSAWRTARLLKHTLRRLLRRSVRRFGTD